MTKLQFLFFTVNQRNNVLRSIKCESDCRHLQHLSISYYTVSNSLQPVESQ